jgi:phosphotransferase system HPr-like phosphotransfer protein
MPRKTRIGVVAVARSLFGVGFEDAECGTCLDLEARGPDAEAAVEALADLVSAQFYENENGEATQGQADTEPAR